MASSALKSVICGHLVVAKLDLVEVGFSANNSSPKECVSNDTFRLTFSCIVLLQHRLIATAQSPMLSRKWKGMG
jgi:hypothetical protein